MKLGFCLPGNFQLPDSIAAGKTEQLRAMVDGYRFMKQTGYDFVEYSVGNITCLSEADMAEAMAYYEQGLLKIEACNCFIPGNLPLAVENVDREALAAHLEKSLSRMAKLGVEIVVLGSGAARRFPEDISYAEGMARLDVFLKDANAVAAKYGITIVLEPLNRSETNCILTVAEGAEIVRRVQLSNVKVLGDAYHMYLEKEDPEVLYENRDILRHVHVAKPEGRAIPDDDPYLRKVGEALRKAEYAGRVSIECRNTDFAAETIGALPIMKKMF